MNDQGLSKTHSIVNIPREYDSMYSIVYYKFEK